MVALGIDLGGTRIKIGLVRDRTIVATASLENRSTPDDLDLVRREVERLLAEYGGVIDGVGIAVPGVVRLDGAGMVRATNKYAYLETLDLREWSLRSFGCDAVVENDARAALAGEVSAGCAEGYADVVMVILGTGVGTAAMMNGRAVRGHSGHAGILGGHQTIDLAGSRCPCGNRGCGEVVAATWNVDRMVSAAESALGVDAGRGLVKGDGPPGFAEVFEHIDTDPVAAKVLDDACAAWGCVVASMVLAYDPALIVLSGGVLRSADLIVPRITDHLDRYLWSSLARPRVAVSRDPDHSVVLGLASLAMTRVADAHHAELLVDIPVEDLSARPVVAPLDGALS